jgi:hypothetical protein
MKLRSIRPRISLQYPLFVCARLHQVARCPDLRRQASQSEEKIDCSSSTVRSPEKSPSCFPNNTGRQGDEGVGVGVSSSIIINVLLHSCIAYRRWPRMYSIVKDLQIRTRANDIILDAPAVKSSTIHILLDGSARKVTKSSTE